MTENGFHHPAMGYWQTISEPDAETIAGYPEGTISVPLKPSADYDWQDGAWVHVPPDPAEALAAERAGMQCSPLQGRLALGEAEWSRVETMLDDPETPWAMRQVIVSASVWHRLSPMIDELAWLMGYDDERVDGLFRAAMQINV